MIVIILIIPSLFHKTSYIVNTIKIMILKYKFLLFYSLPFIRQAFFNLIIDMQRLQILDKEYMLLFIISIVFDFFYYNNILFL
jgi:hypothetical protein